MVDILKITSPVSIKSKVQNLPSKLPTDAIFDITNPNQIIKEPPKTKGLDEESAKQSLLKNLNKEIFEPLLHSTRAQADGVRKLVLMAKFFETPSGILSESFLDRVFVKPQEMLGELLTREKGATIFRGEFFDSLRMLTKMEGQPRLKEAIVSILKYFDCYVNQENSLKAIVKQSQDLIHKLPKAGTQTLQEQVETLDTIVKLSTMARQNATATAPDIQNSKPAPDIQNSKPAPDIQNSKPAPDIQNNKPALDLDGIMKRDKESQAEIKTYLKKEIIPELGKIAKRHQGSEKIYNQVMAIVHNIVRYDKADPKLLEEAIFQLGDTLKPLTNLTDEDVIEMKKLVFENAIEEQNLGEKQANEKKAMEKFGLGWEETDLAALLSKAMDKSGPSKISSVAQNLLMNLVQSESPLVPLLHFTIPFRYMEENTYGEFFVDKDCKERKGDAKTAKNIFFTIQSDKYGNFEVDLLARDKRIDLDIRCPDVMLNPVKETRSKWKEIIEEQGFRLVTYQVGVYQESQTIVQRFPKLALRKVGIDVKV
ncbi:MAG: hypothetical protein PHC91_01900 [Eubacteriales bacterium]|nr:hypothetical protein [Eubacteriales bacterium]